MRTGRGLDCHLVPVRVYNPWRREWTLSEERVRDTNPTGGEDNPRSVTAMIGSRRCGYRLLLAFGMTHQDEKCPE